MLCHILILGSHRDRSIAGISKSVVITRRFLRELNREAVVACSHGCEPTERKRKSRVSREAAAANGIVLLPPLRGSSTLGRLLRAHARSYMLAWLRHCGYRLSNVVPYNGELNGSCFSKTATGFRLVSNRLF